MGKGPPPDDLRANPDDRIGGRRRKAARRDESDGGGEKDRRKGSRRRGFLGLFGRRGKSEGRAPARRAKRRRRSLLGGLAYWSLVLGLWGGVALTGVLAYHAAQLPPIDQLAVPKRPPNIAIYADDGSLLANRGDTGGPAIHLRDLPPYLPHAFVAIEDRRFYAHWGVDVMGVARAVWRNVGGRGGPMQGGSTLTQQLAKNLFLTQERTMSRKIQEAILAVWLERKYSKDQILELYLNRVYFGSGAYGVEAAAQKYFGKSARQVTLQESAILAGLMVAPSRLAPNRNPRGAADRAAMVVTAMAREGHITEAMAKLALSRPAEAVKEAGAGSVNYAADYVMDVLDETVGAIDQDIVVTTTLSPALQSSAERALADELARQGAKFGVSQGALVALDPGGQVKALVGGRSYSDSQFNRAVAARRQPGSAFKPFVYLAALERGLTPETVREDSPVNIRGWRPENSSRRYYGAVTLQQALALSLNTVAARLGQEVGPKSVAATARKLGVHSELTTNATLALGTSEVTPLELTSAYAPFANGGVRVQPHVILRVRTATGKLLYQRKGSGFGRVIEPRHVAMMNAMLRETLATGTARKAELPGWEAAGKTGTSQEYRDAWFVGYTSHLVAGVWLGNDDSSPTKKTSGGNLPVDVWSRFMREAHRSTPPQALPGGYWRETTPPPAPPADIPGVASAEPVARPPAVMPVSTGARLAPPAPVGAPMAINQAGGAQPSQPSPARRRPDPIGDLIPPASVGESASARPRGERSIFDRLFGG